MKRAKLLFYINEAYPLFAKTVHAFGGAEINLYYLSKEFIKKGYDVEFLVGDYGQASVEHRGGVRLRKLKYSNAKIHTCLKYKILRRYNFLKLLWNSDADIYILTTASEMSGYMTFIAGLKNKKTIFRVAHDWDVDKSFSKLNNLKGYMYRYALPRFDAIVVQTNVQRKMLLENEKLKSRVIGNGFPLNNKNSDLVKSSVLWLGRDDPIKRPLLFVELAKRLSGTKCIMIMPGSSQFKKNVKDEAERVSNIEFIGRVDFFDIQSYFDEAICLVNTSEKEGFSNTFIQACISSTPMLSYNIDPDYVISNNYMGLLCNNSTDAAVEFIMSLDKSHIEKYGRNSFEYVKARHDLEEKTDEYENIIRELMQCAE